MDGRTKFEIGAFLIIAGTFTAIFLLALSMAGCSDPMLQGLAIGAGSSEALSGSADIAKESRERLIAEILRLRNEVANAPTPDEKAALEKKLAQAERKQELAELTESIANTVKAGLERDWGDQPASPDNLAWILGSAATVLGGIAGKKTLDDRKKAAAITKIKIASKSEDERKVYEAAGTA